MTGVAYVQSVIDHVPRGMPLREHIALELGSHIAERTARGEPLDAVLQQLGDPLKLAESYLSAVPLQPVAVLPRAAAKLIDVLLVAAVVVSITMLAFFITRRAEGFLLIITCMFGLIFFFPAYTALAEYEYGRTLGKRLMNIRVVRESGARISFGTAVVRQLPFFAQFFWVDALFALFTERRQRAFELLTKTRVVVGILAFLMLSPDRLVHEVQAVQAVQLSSSAGPAPLAPLARVAPLAPLAPLAATQ